MGKIIQNNAEKQVGNITRSESGRVVQKTEPLTDPGRS